MPRLKLKAAPNREKKSSIEKLKERLANTSILKDEREFTKFVNSGSWHLNLALTGNIDIGYPIGRVINAVGDYSTGKTLMACELVNSVYYFQQVLEKKKVKLYYDEPEYAFDLDLAHQFNMPLQYIYGLRERLPNFKPVKNERPFKTSKTVEDLYTNLKWIADHETNEYDVILYVVDSLDSLTDAREIVHLEEKGIEKQDYGGGKARVLSQLFRNCIEGINNSKIILYIVSQIRTNFGVMFGNKYTRAGGKALDHYASQIFWMREAGKITHKDTKLNQGIEVELHITKNKLGERYNKLKFNILHGHGVDNVGSAIDFLLEYGVLQRNGAYINWNGTNILREELIELSFEEDIMSDLKGMMQNTWNNLMEVTKVKRPPKWSEGKKIV